jgi:hypothetical protein
MSDRKNSAFPAHHAQIRHTFSFTSSRLYTATNYPIRIRLPHFIHTLAQGTLLEPLLLPHLPLLLSLQPNRRRIPINSTCCPRAVWTQVGDRPGAVLTAGGRAQSQTSRLRRKQPTRRGRRIPLLPPAPGALPEPPLLSRLHRMPPLQPNFRMQAV